MDLVQIEALTARRPTPRLPPWLRRPATNFQALHELKVEFRRRGLHTVCESARCPNIHECFARKAATFMILGNVCTRTCGFCAVPQGIPGALTADEPDQVASMAAAHGPALRRDHQRQPGRFAGRGFGALRRNRASRQTCSACRAGGSPGAGLPGRLRGCCARARCGLRRLQSQHGDRGAASTRESVRKRRTAVLSTCWPSREATRLGC